MVRIPAPQIVENVFAGYINDPTTRGQRHDDGVCEYRTDSGKKCAVAKCLTDEGIEAFLDAGMDSLRCEDTLPEDYGRYDWEGLDYLGHLDRHLQPEYRGLPVAFWAACQKLHDESGNWTPYDLSDKGKANYKQLLTDAKQFELQRV